MLIYGLLLLRWEIIKLHHLHFKHFMSVHVLQLCPPERNIYNFPLPSPQILHMHIDSVEKLPLTTTGSPLLIRCKTFLSVTYVIPRERECHDLYLQLLKLSQPGELFLIFVHFPSPATNLPPFLVPPVHITDLYCFSYTSDEGQLKEAGWEYFKLESEFKRMRVPNENWTLYDQTLNYEVSLVR